LFVISFFICIFAAESIKLIMPKENHLVEDDNARLDEALAKFSGDFGGSADAITIAKELRQGADMVKEVEAW
jgi:hypothetical protein